MRFNSSKYNQHWNNKVLGELGEFQRGKSRHRPRNDQALFENGIYPLIQTGEIKEANLYIREHTENYNELGLSQSKLWKENTLCITIAANIAETALLGYPMCFPDSVVGFNAYPQESSELFMHYVFTYIKKSIQNSAIGSIQDNINIEYLTQLKFKIPDKAYQDKIAAVLSALDAKIELNNRINAELESLAKTIYDYWFVQFDFPFDFAQGKPSADGKPYKSSGGEMVCVDGGGDRAIPAGWEIKDLGEFGVFKNGVNYDPSQPGDTPAKIVNVRNISKASIFIQNHDLDTINLTSREVNNYLVSDKSILIARSGIPGATRLISDYIKNTIYCGFIICFEVEDPNLKLPLFFFLKKIEKAMNSQSGGTIMKNVNQGTLKSLKVLLPKGVSTNHLIKLFNNTIEPIFKKINLIDEENQQLTQLRDWLLPMLMNGQVSIK
jgi:type I restriction enzyme S subunit